MMRILKGMLLSCLLFLHGCDSVYGQNSVYEQKNGALQYDYVKTASEDFYRGMPVVGVDAATFEVKPDLEDDADAKDARGRYKQGK